MTMWKNFKYHIQLMVQVDEWKCMHYYIVKKIRVCNKSVILMIINVVAIAMIERVQYFTRLCFVILWSVDCFFGLKICQFRSENH